MPEEDVEVVLSYLAAYNAQDLDLALTALQPRPCASACAEEGREQRW